MQIDHHRHIPTEPRRVRTDQGRPSRPVPHGHGTSSRPETTAAPRGHATLQLDARAAIRCSVVAADTPLARRWWRILATTLVGVALAATLLRGVGLPSGASCLPDAPAEVAPRRTAPGESPAYCSGVYTVRLDTTVSVRVEREAHGRRTGTPAEPEPGARGE